MIQSVVQELGRLNYTLQSIRTADYGARMGDSFRQLRDIIREIRSDLTGLNTLMRETATLSGRVGDAATRVRRTRATPAPAAEAATAAAGPITTTAIVATSTALTNVAALGATVTQIMRLNTEVQSLSRSMITFSQATLTATASVRQFSDIGERAYATYLRLKTLALPTGTSGQQQLLQAPGAIGGGLQTRQQQGIQPFIFQGEATEGFGRASERAARQTQIFEGSLVTAKAKKDALDRNLRDTAQNTLPGFNSALTATIAILALFTVRSILRELQQLGQTLFETGRDFENTFALFRAGARNDVEEGSRRMAVAADVAKKLGLGLQQTREDYARLSAAALGSSLEGEKIEKVFRGIAAAQAVLGQNTEKGTGLIKVFTDILGKGRLQSEELVKQLGNIVPGSIRVVAESLGMVPQQLSQAIQRGTLGVEQVLTSLAAEFEKRYGSEAVKNINRLGGAFNVLKTAITEVQQVALNAGVGPGLISGFKTLTDFLNEKETRVAVAQLANFITNVLGAAFLYLINILRFLRDNLESVIKLFVFLTSAAFITGILTLVRAFAFLGNVLLNMSLIGRVAIFAGLIASMILGKTAADKFAEGLEGAQKKFEDMQKEQERLLQLQAKSNDNLPDSTRAQLEAQEKIDKELRIFNQDLQNQIILLEKTTGGMSSLSIEYEAYGKVLDRVTALERTEVFERLSTGDKEKAKQSVINQFFGPEVQALALQEAAKLGQTMEQALLGIRQRIANTRALIPLVQGGATTGILEVERDFLDQIRELQEKYATILANAPASQTDRIAEAFKKQAEAMRQAAVEAGVLSGRLRQLTQVQQGEEELQFQRAALRISLSARNIGITSEESGAPGELARAFPMRGVPTSSRVLSDLTQNIDRAARQPTRTTTVEQTTVGSQVANVGSMQATVTGPATINLSGSVTMNGQNMSGGQPIIPGSRGGISIGNVEPANPVIRGAYEGSTLQRDIKEAMKPELAGGGVITPARVMGAALIAATAVQAYVATRPTDTRTELNKSIGEALRAEKAASVRDRGDGSQISMSIDIEKQSAGAPRPVQQAAATVQTITTTTREMLRQQDTIQTAYEDTLKSVERLTDIQVSGRSRTRIEAEREIAILTAIRDLYRETGVTAEDIANQTPRFFAQQENAIRRGAQALELFNIENKKTSQDYIRSIEEENRAIQDQIDVLQLDVTQRQAELEFKQRIREINEQIIDPRQRQEALALARANKELKLSYEELNGPLRQYTDSLGSLSNLNLEFQKLSVNVLSGAQDLILNFDQALERRAGERQSTIQESISKRQRSLESQARELERNLPSGQNLRDADQSRRALQAQKLREEVERLGQATQDIETKFSVLDKAGIFFSSLADIVIENIKKMTLEILIFKPLAEELQMALSGTSDSTKGYSGLLSGILKLGGAAASAYGGTGGFTGGDFPGAATGGMVTIHGIRHFQNGGFTGMGTDTVPAMLTPGEIILNRAQQKNVASAMDSSRTFAFNIVLPNVTTEEQGRRTGSQIASEVYARLNRANKRDGLTR
jgi:tape measure domain-containing protein